jgi:hypothetical protein
MKLLCEAMDDLGTALAYREDIAQAAFERWLVEKLLTVTQAQVAHAEATCKQDLQVEPCNKSCAPGYCYCEPMARPISHVGTYYGKKNPALERPIIKPEIKGHNAEPDARDVEEVLRQTAHHKLVAVRQHFVKGTSPQEQAEPDRVPVKRSGMQALSKALGHPTQISAKDGDTVDDALIELAVSRLEQAEQAEPVAWMVYTQDGKSVCVTDNPADFTSEHRALPLYTAPPRQWQTLSDEDVERITSNLMTNSDGYLRFSVSLLDFARAISAKIEELNK